MESRVFRFRSTEIKKIRQLEMALSKGNQGTTHPHLPYFPLFKDQNKGIRVRLVSITSATKGALGIAEQGLEKPNFHNRR